MVGGMRPFRTVSSDTTASTAPAAVSVCPIIDLLDEIGTRAMRSPNTAMQPMDSILSFSGVPVPWALTVSMSSGERSASSSASLIAAMIGAPSGLERVRWKPSPRSPQPST